jgi:hypothetical protein
MEDKILFKGFTNNETFIERGEYQETELDKAKKEADMLLQAIGRRYCLYMNRSLGIKPSRSIEVREETNMIYATERAYNKLKEQYNIMCDF